jgi:hypothetical protein
MKNAGWRLAALVKFRLPPRLVRHFLLDTYLGYGLMIVVVSLAGGDNLIYFFPYSLREL